MGIALRLPLQFGQFSNAPNCIWPFFGNTMHSNLNVFFWCYCLVYNFVFLLLTSVCEACFSNNVVSEFWMGYNNRHLHLLLHFTVFAFIPRQDQREKQAFVRQFYKHKILFIWQQIQTGFFFSFSSNKNRCRFLSVQYKRNTETQMCLASAHIQHAKKADSPAR